MVEVGEDLWRSSAPTPLCKQGHLEPVVQDRVQMAFENLQRWRLHNLFGQPVPLLGHPHSTQAFLDVQSERPVFPSAPMASCPTSLQTCAVRLLHSSPAMAMYVQE